MTRSKKYVLGDFIDRSSAVLLSSPSKHVRVVELPHSTTYREREVSRHLPLLSPVQVACTVSARASMPRHESPYNQHKHRTNCPSESFFRLQPATSFGHTAARITHTHTHTHKDHLRSRICRDTRPMASSNFPRAIQYGLVRLLGMCNEWDVRRPDNVEARHLTCSTRH